MTDRILDFSEGAADIAVEHGGLVVRRGGAEIVRFPFDEVAVIVLAHPGVRITQAALAGAAAHGIPVIACDERRLPVAMTMTIAGHHAQTERFLAQVGASLPRKKRAWQQIVRAKIRAQASALHRIRGTDGGLSHLIARVRSGDPENVEAIAARRYWTRVFPQPGFRRDPESGGTNSLLNYGYAVLRGIVARAIVAVGLHPTLGLHHRGRHDPFCLADDLMEPLRPLVDEAVASLVIKTPGAELDRETKPQLLAPLLARYDVEEASRTLFDIALGIARSTAALYLDKADKLWLPDCVPSAVTRPEDEA